MLASLSIKNYALIDDLKVEFNGGLSIITGETGAGKSILMGGLALVLGKRADSSLVYKKDRKCIIEAEFQIGSYALEPFFIEHDLDYDPWVIIRREILPNGKSRAFINDTPVTLQVLNRLSRQLIDIHSQHETLQLAEPLFQFDIVDSLAENAAILSEYAKAYANYKLLVKEQVAFEEAQRTARKEYDYHLFLLEELVQANLKEGEQEELEQELEKLSHVEEIKEKLTGILEISQRESLGTLSQLSEIENLLSRIGSYADLYSDLSDRMKSVLIEFKDLLDEVENENDQLVYDPEVLLRVQDRLQLFYDLQKKHGVSSISGLMEVRESYQLKVDHVDDAEGIRSNLSAKIEASVEGLKALCTTLHQNRKKAIPTFVSHFEKSLSNLEMKNTRLKVSLEKSDDFLLNGSDRLVFLMSSDKGKTFESLNKVASGGEMSRMMLAVKSILSQYSSLPAIIFDEIDTGVSGEVSNRIAEVMLGMSANMQVITITHLPQVAAKGHHHYKVYKEEKTGALSSNIKELNEDERLVELAEMLGGTDISESAIAHAKQLLS